MAESYNIFNPVGAQEAPRAVNTDLYKVNRNDSKSGVYNATLRFLPWVQNPARCIVDKQVSWVKNELTGKGMYVDDPRSIGEFSPVTDMFFKMYNTKVDRFVSYAKQNLSSKMQYASLVQIINDEQHPELNGQIKIFVYGKTIWQKLYDQEHFPGIVPVNPFHPIEGRYFYLRCVEKSGFNNFDQSMFADNAPSNAMWMPGPDGMMHQIDVNTDQNAVVEYLRANSPDLGKYEYQPWTADQAKFVDEVLQISNQLLTTGTIQTNMSALAGVNAQPAAQAMMPGVGMVGAPNGMPQGQPAQPTAQMPQMPPMNTPAQQPANNSFGSFSIGSVPSTGSTPMNPTPNPANPGISGVTLPPNMGTQQPAAPNQQSGSIGGNIDDILNTI